MPAVHRGGPPQPPSGGAAEAKVRPLPKGSSTVWLKTSRCETSPSERLRSALMVYAFCTGGTKADSPKMRPLPLSISFEPV